MFMPAIKTYDRSRWTVRQLLGYATFVILLLSFCFSGYAPAQESARKVTARTAPSYPDLAKRMHLSGKAKLELVITPAGAVKAAKFAGGNPVFEKSAIEAVKQWRFETASSETKETVLIEFVEPQ
jgi:TonB family protein